MQGSEEGRDSLLDLVPLDQGPFSTHHKAEPEEAAYQPGAGPLGQEGFTAVQATSFTLTQFTELYRNDSLFSLGSSAYAMSELAAGEDGLLDLDRLSGHSPSAAFHDLLTYNNSVDAQHSPSTDTTAAAAAAVPAPAGGTTHAPVHADTATAAVVGPAVAPPTAGVHQAAARLPHAGAAASADSAAHVDRTSRVTALEHQDPTATPVSPPRTTRVAFTQHARRASSPPDLETPVSSAPLLQSPSTPVTPWSEAPSLPDMMSLTLTTPTTPDPTASDANATPAPTPLQTTVHSTITALMQSHIGFAVMLEADHAAAVSAAAAGDVQALDTLLRERPVRFALGWPAEREQPSSPEACSSDPQQGPSHARSPSHGSTSSPPATGKWKPSLLVELIRSPFSFAKQGSSFTRQGNSPRASIEPSNTSITEQASTAAVNALLAGGQDLHLLSASDLSRLQAAASPGDVPAAREMLCIPEASPYVELGGGRVEREAGLHAAAGLGNVAWLLQGLSHNVDVNSTEEGTLKTPLMQAAASGCLHTSVLLLHHGAFSQLKDRAGRTASHLAKQHGHTSVSCMIRAANAKRDSLLLPCEASEPSTLANLRLFAMDVQRSVSSVLTHRPLEGRASGGSFTNSPRH
ncbi:MAG: hypothetical protein WDW38_005486 [Sanguina aurantia]